MACCHGYRAQFGMGGQNVTLWHNGGSVFRVGYVCFLRLDTLHCGLPLDVCGLPTKGTECRWSCQSLGASHGCVCCCSILLVHVILFHHHDRRSFPLICTGQWYLVRSDGFLYHSRSLDSVNFSESFASCCPCDCHGHTGKRTCDDRSVSSWRIDKVRQQSVKLTLLSSSVNLYLLDSNLRYCGRNGLFIWWSMAFGLCWWLTGSAATSEFDVLWLIASTRRLRLANKTLESMPKNKVFQGRRMWIPLNTIPFRLF